MRDAKREEVLMQDGSVHSCEGDALYRPLAYIAGARYYCKLCGTVFKQINGAFRATGDVEPVESVSEEGLTCEDVGCDCSDPPVSEEEEEESCLDEVSAVELVEENINLRARIETLEAELEKKNG